MTSFVVLTGAAGGLGTDTARHLASSGYNLILTDIYAPTELLEELEQYDTTNFAYEVDVTQPTSLVDFSLEISSLGEIAGLVTLAGITRDRTINNMTEEEWDDVIDVNLKGTYLSIQSIAKIMSKGGSIITIGSVVSNFGNFGQANYVASKAGVEGLTKVAAREFARKDIRVNCILPGFIQTPMAEEVPDDRIDAIIDQIPLNRMGKPGEIASVIEFLLSDKSSYLTGSSLNVNGGLWMG